MSFLPRSKRVSTKGKESSGLKEDAYVDCFVCDVLHCFGWESEILREIDKASNCRYFGKTSAKDIQG